MSPSTVTVDVREGIATICFNRPRSLNAITADDYSAFANALRDVDKRDDVQVTIWQATGNWFCAGTDVRSVGGRLTTNTLRDHFLESRIFAPALIMDAEKNEKFSDTPSVASASVDRNYYHDAELELHDPTAANESLHRGLKARQISMIALGGAVGTGLIIGTSTALPRGGPLGLFLGYMFIGFVCWMVMCGLGEMAAYLPHSKGFAGYATRFVDPALGFALGWNYLFKYLIVTPNNLNAAGVVLTYWSGARKVPKEAWMAIFIVFIALFNLLGVRVFGEMEFWFSSIKVITLIGLLFLGIIIDLGGNPHHDRIGFRNWQHPHGPMGHYLKAQVHEESLSIFLGFFAVLSNALFAYIGTELQIPAAIKRTFWRILVFYVGGVFVIGLITPSTDDLLFTATKAKAGAAASPFIVATTLVGIKTLDHVLNAAILCFVLSAANSDLYIGSRTLYGLAVEGKAPRIFAKTNRNGVPWIALITCLLFCLLVYLNVSSGAAKVFGYFVNLVSAFGALTWISICISHIAFMRALKAQGRSRDSLPYKAPFQPFGSWFALITTTIILFFKGFDSFIPWKVDTFVTSYIAIPVFIVFFLGYKFYYGTKFIPSEKVDLTTGLKAIDDAEQAFLAEEEAKGPRSFWGRIWDGM
ncbi:AA-permease domain-containing protein [Mycena kentingensis (nom. inval.)]|nr:AA-permease domain-containing protein [Mycena kentingensis (nom. inval.)]